MKSWPACRAAVLSAFLLLIPSVLAAAQAPTGGVRIVSPANGTVVEPGQSFTVVVEPEPGVTPAFVALLSPQIMAVKQQPPFIFTVSFPTNSPLGPETVIADGLDARERPLRTQVTLDVETTIPVTSIRVEPTRLFFGRSREDSLSVRGTFADSQARIITKSHETAYVSSNPQVVTVDAQGLVKAVGEGTATITVTYKGKSVTVPVKVEFERQSIKIDIRPGDPNNRINLDSGGSIPVAILTTKTFDVTRVDPLSVRFGPNGAMEEHGRGHFEDVDGDGFSDMVLHFRQPETGIQCLQKTAVLTGSTFDGVLIRGVDTIRPHGHNCLELPQR